MKRGMNIPLMSMDRYMFPSNQNGLLPKRMRRKLKRKQKLKRSYANVTIPGVTSCSAGVGSYKEKKNWREVAEYLHSSVDRAQFLRREGCVLICNLAALKQEVEKMNAGQH